MVRILYTKNQFHISAQKLISTSSYGQDIVYQISTSYLKLFLRYRVRKKA